VRYAGEHPDRQVVFLRWLRDDAPATAAAVMEANAAGLTNFTVLMGHKLVIPAMSALLAAGDVPSTVFCARARDIVIGARAYQPIVDQHHRPAWWRASSRPTCCWASPTLSSRSPVAKRGSRTCMALR